MSLKETFLFTEKEKMTGRTPELIFVVHKHAATRLHYDFRLEREGVLKSWAVPKELPLMSGVKRLAIQVEDHVREYANFSGTIAEGHYGAGTVELWDRGTYISQKWDEHEIIVTLMGKKMKGVYCLIKLKKNVFSDANWLIFKRKETAQTNNE
jgi:bifunctional non-homologous end joining protein LigD